MLRPNWRIVEAGTSIRTWCWENPRMVTWATPGIASRSSFIRSA